MGRTVGELEAGMSSGELAGWLAFDAEYGIGDHYFTTAAVCRTLAGSLGGKDTTGADYVPFFRPPARPQTVAEQRAAVRARLAAARPGRV